MQRNLCVLLLVSLVARVCAQYGNGVTTSCSQTALCGLGCVNTNANGTCYQCGLNWYKPTTNSTACLACPENTTGLYTISSTVTNCWCGKGFQGPNGGPCTMCTTGKAKSTDGSSACFDCGSGKYSNTIGANTCKYCPKGTYTLQGANSVCVQCPGNSTTEITGSPSASYCKCNLGFLGPPSPSEPRGPPCTPCPAGTERPSTAAGMCYECDPGTYAPAPGTPTCLTCPVSKYADGYGMTACIDCDLGYTGPTGGPCVACAAGKYKATTGSTACTPCRAQSTSPVASTSSAACLCNAGLTFDGYDCVGCEWYTYKDTIGNEACPTCPSNSYYEDPPNAEWDTPRLSSSCVPCPSGSFCANVPRCGDIRDCRCEAGHYGQRSSVCLPCEPGSYAADIDYQYCPLCYPGTYQDMIGATACKQCPPGTSSDYTATGGPVTCTGCPAGTAFDGPTNACVVSCNYQNVFDTNPQRCTTRAAGMSACPVLNGLWTNASAAEVAAFDAALGQTLTSIWTAITATNELSNATACGRQAPSRFTDFYCQYYGGSDAIFAPCLAGGQGLKPCYGQCVALEACLMTASPSMCAQISPAAGVACLGPAGIAGECVCGAGATRAGGACVACAQGTYKADAGDGACVACGAGNTSPAGSLGPDACVVTACDAGYTVSGGVCSACPAGTWKNTTGPAACESCGARTYSTSIGATDESVCVPCAPNTGASCVGCGDASACTCDPGYAFWY